MVSGTNAPFLPAHGHAHTLFDIGELRVTCGIPKDVEQVITSGKPIDGLF